jgi:hypothetical protein
MAISKQNLCRKVEIAGLKRAKKCLLGHLSRGSRQQGLLETGIHEALQYLECPLYRLRYC